MKRIFTKAFIAIALFGALATTGQTVVAKWTFPTGTPSDSLADGGIPANLTKAIHTEGGTSAIDFSKNGLTTKAAQATGWDNGAMTKSWVIGISTVNFDHLKLSSKQQSGGNNPGPRDFVVRYRIGTGGTWKDVPGTTIVTANNWTNGVLDSIPLPDTCANQSSLWLQWVMTSDTNSVGALVTSAGIDKIDDIYITGKQVMSAVNNSVPATVCIYPNPVRGELIIESSEPVVSVSLLNAGGMTVLNQNMHESTRQVVNTTSLPAGLYIVKILQRSGRMVTRKIVIG